MNESKFMNKISKIPVPLLPAMVGACTLSNVYLTLGFSWLRHIFMILGAVLIVCYFIKIIGSFDIVKKEYTTTVPSSLYAGFTMLLMILGSYVFDFHAGIGKGIWFVGLILHGLHILAFTFLHVLKGVKMETFLPSWFVTYVGILVSCVVGGAMEEKAILTVIVYYGIVIYFILLFFLFYRLIKYPIKEPTYHTLAIIMAPCCLCLVGYLNIIDTPNATLVWVLYACVFVSLLFVLSKIPKFFSFSFTPGFAGMTFPMAIGVVASAKMSGYLSNTGFESLAEIVKEVQGIQIYVTTIIIGFVLYNFVRHMKNC